MKPIHIAALAAVLAVAALLLYVFGSGGDESAPVRRETVRSLRTDASRSGSAGEKDSAAGRKEAPGGFSVTLKVVGPGSEAVSGVDLTLVGLETLRSATNREGTGRFAGLAPGSYDLLARKGSAVAARSFQLETNLDLGTLRLVESVAIRGHVYGAKNKPVEGARVAALSSGGSAGFDLTRFVDAWLKPDPVAASTSTDGEGAYELRVAKGGTFTLRVIARGYAQEGEPARAYPADTGPMDFYLFRGTTVAGVVVDPQGKPIPAARVMISDPTSLFARRMMPKMETISGPGGGFSLSVAPSRQTMLTVRAVGYALHMAPLRLPALDLRIVLDPGIRFRLRTVDARNSVPVPGVTAMVSYRGGFAKGLTDAGGELVLEHLSAKTQSLFGNQQQVFLFGGGFVPKTVDLRGKEPVEGVLDAGEIALDRGGTIRGRVLDAKTREPVAGARVRAFGGLDMQVQVLGAVPVLSDEKGAFELLGVPLGASLLLAQHEDYVSDVDFNPVALFSTSRSGKPLFKEGETEITKDILLTPAVKVEGKVLDPRGDPVPGALVAADTGPLMMLMRVLGNRPSEAVTDASGGFSLSDLSSKRPVKLVASHREYGAAKATTVRPGSGEAVTLVLTDPIQLRGKVVDESGDPIEGLRVTVARKTNTTGRNVFSPIPDQGSARPAVTDSKGGFLVRNAPEGDLIVRFEHADYRPAAKEVRTSAGTPRHDLGRIVIERGPGIEGTVLGPEGKPVSDATVSATVADMTGADDDTQGRTWATGVTDKEGRFSLSGLRDAEYDLQPNVQGFYGESKRVRSGTTDVRLALRPAAKIEGRVTSAGRPVAGATVRAERPEEAETSGARFLGWARTDASGMFTMSPLPPNRTFTLVIEHDAYVRKRVEGVAAGGPRREFILDPGIQVGGVVLDRDHLPVAGAQLRVGAGNKTKFVSSGADGTWVAGGLDEGEITVDVSSRSGFVKQDPIPVEPGDLNVKIVVERGETISGTLVGDLEKGRQFVLVEALNENGDVASTVYLWSTSRDFRLQGLPRGRYLVRATQVEDDGTRRVVASAQEVRSGTEDLELTIH